MRSRTVTVPEKSGPAEGWSIYRLDFKAVLVLWVPVLFYAGMIFFLSSQSLDFIGEGPFPQWDKVAHGTEYGLFCFLLLRTLRWTFPRAAIPTLAVWAVLIAVAYGASDEFHQAFVPHRDSDVFDVLADGGGASFVSAVWVLWNKKKPNTP